MPSARLDDTLDMHYELDDYTDPWTTPETILLVHGVADTSRAWFAWVPLLARRFRVLRPDLRLRQELTRLTSENIQRQIDAG